jgi:hypothetical protein
MFGVLFHRDDDTINFTTKHTIKMKNKYSGNLPEKNMAEKRQKAKGRGQRANVKGKRDKERGRWGDFETLRL